MSRMDASLLTLFRAELRSHGRALVAGLESGEPQWEALWRAAHSLRGAAHVVAFRPLESLAAAMEEALGGARAAGALSPRTTAVLGEAAALLAGAGELADAEIEAWQRSNGDTLVALTGRIAGDAPPPARSTAPSGLRVDAGMVELFRQEAEAHSATLGQGLLALEADPGHVELLEALMRSAHSIKGAARVVGLDVGVELAHAVEDALVAAQRGLLELGGDEIDLLLRAADLLAQLANATGDQLSDWLATRGAELGAMSSELRRLVARAHLAVGAGTRPTAARASQRASPRTPEARERVVRVTVENIDRLMELSGESVVETMRLAPFAAALHELRSAQRRVADLLEELRVVASRATGDPRVRELAAEAQAATAATRTRLDRSHAEFEEFARRSNHLSRRLYREAIASRMRPFGDALHGLPRLVRDLAKKLGKRAELAIEGAEVGVDRDILEKLEAPLNQMLRNAIDHGIELPEERAAAGKNESGAIRVEARHWAGVLTVVVADDGRGIEPESVRRRIVERGLASAEEARTLDAATLLDYVFSSGFSTAAELSEISGRGVGLDVVRSVAQEVGGSARVASEPGRGTSVHLQLPITLSVVRAVVVEVAGEPYAFPLTRVERIVRLERSQLFTVENRRCFTLEGETIGLVAADEVLELAGATRAGDDLCAVVLAERSQRCALLVDSLRGEHDLVVRPLDPRLGKVADVAAASILPDGTPLLILDVEDLMRSIVRLLRGGNLGEVDAPGAATKAAAKRVLVVDDSITVREVQRQLLANLGYAVEVAVDGMDGWNAVRNGDFDLVISDVDMPRMNGIELVRSIKQDPRLRSIPVMIVSYKDRDEDRMRGLEVGADYYLTKSDFHDEQLVRAVVDLVGEAGR